MQRRTVTLLVLAALLTIFRAESAIAQASSTIGVLLPLTGPLTVIGEAAKDGIQMASREFDPLGKVGFAFEDFAFDSAKAAALAKKLVEIDKVAALVIFGTGGAQVCAPIAERAKVPLIAMAMDRGFLKNKKYSFDYYVGEGSLNDMAAAEVGLKLGLPGEPALHSTRLVLVDKSGAIRGYYSSTDDKEVQKLINDLNFSALH